VTHPIIPQILELAIPLAEQFELEIVEVVFQTNRRPPVLRVDIRHPSRDTGLDDCEQMSRALEPILDAKDIIPGTYVLEISSPGISRQIVTEREFMAFKGFDVSVKTEPPYEGRKEWQGQLQGKDESAIRITQKGRAIAIPCSCVVSVQLDG
jgi:ribosome maturation factor RimP